jgi:hypothetical protein
LFDQPTGPTQIETIVADNVLHHFSFQRGPDHFFVATS